MEKIDQIAKMAELQTGNLPKLLHESSLSRSDGFYTLSVYAPVQTTLCIIEQVKRIKLAFPSLPEGFYDMLTDRIKDLQLPDQQLIDAVNNLIDTCVYPHPTIANILTWKKSIKLYSYKDIVKLVNEYGVNVWDNYKRVIIADSDKLFASLEDITKYGLTVKPDGPMRFE
jgi:hypothetical protein